MEAVLNLNYCEAFNGEWRIGAQSVHDSIFCKATSFMGSFSLPSSLAGQVQACYARHIDLCL